MEIEVLVAAVSSLMVMIPLWRITRRTGRDPWLSLLFLGTPPVGTLVFVAILAFGRWPAERGAGAPSPDGGQADGESSTGGSSAVESSVGGSARVGAPDAAAAVDGR